MSFSIDHSHDVPEVEFHTEEGIRQYCLFLEYVESGQFDRDMNEIRESIEDLRNRVKRLHEETVMVPT